MPSSVKVRAKCLAVVVVILVVALRSTSAEESATDKCVCDRWWSSNTIRPPTSLAHHRSVYEGITGSRYVGARNVSARGVPCLPWSEVFDRCTTGFQRNPSELGMAKTAGQRRWLDSYHKQEGELGRAKSMALYMSPATPDGLTGGRSRDGGVDPFDGNACRVPHFAPMDEVLRKTIFSDLKDFETLHALLVTNGPFCFVNASDPRVSPYVTSNTDARNPELGDLRWWGRYSPQHNVNMRCEGVVPVTCDLPMCDAPSSCVAPKKHASSTTSSTTSSASSVRVLLADGGIESWRRASRLVVHRDGDFDRLKLKSHPPFPDGYNAEVPTFFELCVGLFEMVMKLNAQFRKVWYVARFGDAGDIIANPRLQWTGNGDGHWGHENLAYVSQAQCTHDARVAAGAKIEKVLGRAGAGTYAARVSYDSTEHPDANEGLRKYNALNTLHVRTRAGATASLAANVTYTAKAWVRCARGSFSAAIVVSAHEDKGRPNIHRGDTSQNIFLPRSTHRKNTTPTVVTLPDVTDGTQTSLRYESCESEGERGGEWFQLAISVRPSIVAREIYVAVAFGMPPDTTGDITAAKHVFAADVDDVTLEREVEENTTTTTSTTTGNPCNATAATYPCRDHPSEMVYRLREEFGVPVTYVQYHSLMRLATESIQCRIPDPSLVDASSSDCPHLARAVLPHADARGVRERLAKMTDQALAAHMGWNDSKALAPGVATPPNAALAFLRERLPEAVETGVIKGFDVGHILGSQNMHHHPKITSDPVSQILWYSRASTSYLKAFDSSTEVLSWRQCAHKRGLRESVCYLWATSLHLLFCRLFKRIMTEPDWEHYLEVRGSPMFASLLSTFNTQITEATRPVMHNATVDGKLVCASSMTKLMDDLDDEYLSILDTKNRVPNEVPERDDPNTRTLCSAPMRSMFTEGLLYTIAPEYVHVPIDASTLSPSESNFSWLTVAAAHKPADQCTDWKNINWAASDIFREQQRQFPNASWGKQQIPNAASDSQSSDNPSSDSQSSDSQSLDDVIAGTPQPPGSNTGSLSEDMVVLIVIGIVCVGVMGLAFRHRARVRVMCEITCAGTCITGEGDTHDNGDPAGKFNSLEPMLVDEPFEWLRSFVNKHGYGLSVIPSSDIRITHAVGSGAASVVYSAVAEKISTKDLPVALKLFSKAMKLEASEFENLLPEVVTMCNCRHPNIINIYGITIVPAAGLVGRLAESLSSGSNRSKKSISTTGSTRSKKSVTFADDGRRTHSSGSGSGSGSKDALLKEVKISITEVEESGEHVRSYDGSDGKTSKPGSGEGGTSTSSGTAEMRQTERSGETIPHDGLVHFGIVIEMGATTLKDVFDSGNMSLRSKLRIATGIASGLLYLHTREPPIVHHDIKPANIVLRSDGTACLVDFGVAKQNASMDSTFTMDEDAANKVQGTFNYLAPEVFDATHVNEENNIAEVAHVKKVSSQVSDGLSSMKMDAQESEEEEEEETKTKALTIRTKPTSMDIYALGCVFLQMWWIPESSNDHVDVDPDRSRQPSKITQVSSKKIMSLMPFSFKNRLQRLGVDESTMTSWIPLHVPPELASITLRTLSREPAKRPTAAEIVDVLSSTHKHLAPDA